MKLKKKKHGDVIFSINSEEQTCFPLSHSDELSYHSQIVEDCYPFHPQWFLPKQKKLKECVIYMLFVLKHGYF